MKTHTDLNVISSPQYRRRHWSTVTRLGFVIAALSASSVVVPRLSLAQVDNIDKPLTSGVAGDSAGSALSGVFRILDNKRGVVRTGFLHKSGHIITANDVVADADPTQLQILLNDIPTSQPIEVTSIIRDPLLNLAALRPKSKLPGTPLTVRDIPAGAPSSEILRMFPVGMPISMWGYPATYRSRWPLLFTGYVSGGERLRSSTVSQLNQLIVNGSYDVGLTGSPVLDALNGEVVGVLLPEAPVLSPESVDALQQMATSTSGATYEITTSNGSKAKIPVDRLVAQMLQELFALQRLSKANAVAGTHLAAFLRELPTLDW